MSGWKDWQIGEVVTEGDFQSFMQDQVVQRYADSTARDSTLGTAVAEGMVSYLDDTNSTEVYTGSDWQSIGGDITAVTAGTGLTGGGTAGDVTLSADYAAIGSAITVDQDQVTGLTSGTQGFTALSNGTAGISYQPVSHNYIINGAFDVWQRGTSFASGTSVQYTADRWQKNFGLASSVARQTFTPADIQAVGFGDAEYFLRFTMDSADTPLIEQKIEDVRTLAGQTVTLSFFAKANSEVSYSAQIRQQFGSGGSADVTLNNTVTVGTTWSRIATTFTLGSIAGKTIGAGSALNVRPITNPGAGEEIIDLWGVQLEAGSVATPFKRHAPSLQGELAACQRYYYRLNATIARPLAVSGFTRDSTQAFGLGTFPVTMRVAPTGIEQSGTASNYRVTDTDFVNYTCSVVPSYEVTTDSIYFVKFVVASGLTANSPVILRQNNNDAYLAWSAEL